MGGPMGAYEEDAHPWLVEEKRAIAAAARAGHPVWGVCLGAQLLASALGADVYPGPAAEVGLLPVELTPEAADDPVFRHAPASFPTLQWHGDTFDLPDGATLLASCPPTAARRSCSSAPTASSSTSRCQPELAAEWGEVPAYSASLEAIKGPGALDRLVGEVTEHAAATAARARPVRTLARARRPCPGPDLRVESELWKQAPSLGGPDRTRDRRAARQAHVRAAWPAFATRR